METVTVEIKKCRKCKTVQWPRYDQETGQLTYSKICKNQKCKSPYWNKPRVRLDLAR